MEQVNPWYVEGNSADDNAIIHAGLAASGDDVAVTIYLRGEDVEEQALRLAALLSRVAPDGVIPEDAA